MSSSELRRVIAGGAELLVLLEAAGLVFVLTWLSLSSCGGP